jgi:tryptophanyl-tRNA synthetase
MSKKIITGIKSTGSSLHLGNLMWAVLPFAETAQGNDAAIFIADLHSLTSVKDGKTLREQTLEIAIEYFAIYGLDTPFTIFRQSDIHDITKLMWIIANVTPYSLMLRAHSFKDAEAKNADLNMWVFNYPILMAADIIGYDIDAVPVGEDQIQHLEMTRDIVRAFNKTYGKEVFKEPEAIVPKSLGKLPGVDGRKMSKSYDNFIGVFDDEKTLRKRVMSIVSGSEWVDERKKNPDECNIFNLYRVFATPEQTAELRKKYESEGIGFGYGHAKTELLNVLSAYLRPYREAREALLKNPELVEARLAEGARVMNARLDEKMKQVKEVVGVN